MKYLSNILYNYPVSASSNIDRCTIKNNHYGEYQKIVEQQKIFCDIERAQKLYKYRKHIIAQYIHDIDSFIMEKFGDKNYYLLIGDDYRIQMSDELTLYISHKINRPISHDVMGLYTWAKHQLLDFDAPAIYNKIKFLASDLRYIAAISTITADWIKYAPKIMGQKSGRTTPDGIMAGSKLLRALVAVPEDMSYMIVDCKAADPFTNSILSGDINFQQIFTGDGDPYFLFAEKIGFSEKWDSKKRKQTKLFLNAVSNGMSLNNGIYNILDITDDDARFEVEDKFLAHFDKLIEYLDETRGAGYIETPHHYHVIEDAQKNSAPALWSQGVGADILRLAHMRLQQYISLENKKWIIAATLHDDIRIYAPHAEKKECGQRVAQIMRMAAVDIFAEMGQSMNGLELITDIETHDTGQVFEDVAVKSCWHEIDQIIESWVTTGAYPQPARTILDTRIGDDMHHISIDKHIDAEVVIDLIRQGAMRGLDTVLVAPPGSGKSTIMRRLVRELINPVNDGYAEWPRAGAANGLSVIVSTSREGLCRQTHLRLSEALGKPLVRLYEAADRHAGGVNVTGPSVSEARVLVSTPHSLPSELGRWHDYDDVRMVVVDELRLYHADLRSGPMKRHIEWWGDIFTKKTQDIPHVFLDANFDGRDLDRLVEWRGKNPQVIIITQDIEPTPLHYVTPNDLWHHIHQAAARCEKFVFATDELSNVDKINRVLTLCYPHLNVLTVTGRPVDKFIASDVISDANKARNYDVIVYNHAINVGWSIDAVAGIASFQHTFSLITHRFFEADGVHQGICRNRECKSIYVAVQTRRDKDNSLDGAIIDAYNEIAIQPERLSPGSFTDLSARSALNYLFWRDEYVVKNYPYNLHEKIKVEIPITEAAALADMLKQPFTVFLSKTKITNALLSLHRTGLSENEKSKIINGLKIQSIYNALGIKIEYQDVADERKTFIALDKKRSEYTMRHATLANPLDAKKIEAYISLSKSSFFRVKEAELLICPGNDVRDDYHQYLRWAKDSLHAAIFAAFVDEILGLPKFDAYMVGKIEAKKRQRQKSDEIKIELGLRIDVEKLVIEWIDKTRVDIDKLHRITSDDQPIRTVNLILRKVCGVVSVDRVRNNKHPEAEIVVLVVADCFRKQWLDHQLMKFFT